MSSIRRADLLSLANLREDGRRPEELRRMTIQMGPSGGGESSVGSGLTASGSALVRMGLTTVLARVMGPTDCTRKADELPDR